MNEARALSRWIFSAAFLALAVLPSVLQAAGSSAYLGNNMGINSRAVDARGVRHTSTNYPHALAPWFHDRVKAFAPDYPYRDRAQRNQGTGVFRLRLDLKTGAVARVTMLKSTGFVTLDRAALASFYHWRWKPGKWKEIEVPITFTMSPRPAQLRRGAVPIPSLGQ
jgi:protein TonB